MEIAQAIDVVPDPGGRGIAIHVPSWFAVLGLLLTMASVAGTAVSLASLWSQFQGHEKLEWHEAARDEMRVMIESLVESQATQQGVLQRLDQLERRIERQ